MSNNKTLDLLWRLYECTIHCAVDKVDHNIEYVEYDIMAKRIKQASHKI